MVQYRSCAKKIAINGPLINEKALQLNESLFKGPLVKNNTDENELFELFKISNNDQMQEYLEIEENLRSDDTNVSIKTFISIIVDIVRFNKNNLESSEEDEESDER
ncbi:hypothetical protein TNCV_114381 [Trichonephila clavipes]|nr:hypothetical protein TNCV_114381 [Trichonephila clavipes]